MTGPRLTSAWWQSFTGALVFENLHVIKRYYRRSPLSNCTRGKKRRLCSQSFPKFLPPVVVHIRYGSFTRDTLGVGNHSTLKFQTGFSNNPPHILTKSGQRSVQLFSVDIHC